MRTNLFWIILKNPLLFSTRIIKLISLIISLFLISKLKSKGIIHFKARITCNYSIYCKKMNNRKLSLKDLKSIGLKFLII